MSEGLAEEDLALFDTPMNPDPTLNKAQEAKVNRAVNELDKVLKAEKLVLDWRSHQQSRAAARHCIEIELEKLPEVYTPDIFEAKCDLAYRHVFDHYVGPGESVYQGAAN